MSMTSDASATDGDGDLTDWDWLDPRKLDDGGWLVATAFASKAQKRIRIIISDEAMQAMLHDLAQDQ